MHHLSTNVSKETARKMETIARHYDLNPKRYAAQVIEKAVDELFRKITVEQAQAKPEVA